MLDCSRQEGSNRSQTLAGPALLAAELGGEVYNGPTREHALHHQAVFVPERLENRQDARHARRVIEPLENAILRIGGHLRRELAVGVADCEGAIPVQLSVHVHNAKFFYPVTNCPSNAPAGECGKWNTIGGVKLLPGGHKTVPTHLVRIFLVRKAEMACAPPNHVDHPPDKQIAAQSR